MISDISAYQCHQWFSGHAIPNCSSMRHLCSSTSTWNRHVPPSTPSTPPIPEDTNPEIPSGCSAGATIHAYYESQSPIRQVCTSDRHEDRFHIPYADEYESQSLIRQVCTSDLLVHLISFQSVISSQSLIRQVCTSDLFLQQPLVWAGLI